MTGHRLNAKAQKITRVFAEGERVQLNNRGRKAIRSILTIVDRLTPAEADARLARMAGVGTVVAVPDAYRVTVQFARTTTTITRQSLTHVHD
jgi:hypothetical protein